MKPESFDKYLEAIRKYDTQEIAKSLKDESQAISFFSGHFPAFMELRPAAFIIDYPKGKYISCNEKLEPLSGYSRQRFMEGGLEFTNSICSSEDMKIYSDKVLLENMCFFADKPIHEHKDYRLNCSYRVRTVKGETKFIEQQTIVIKSAGDGTPLILAGIAHDISAYKRSSEMIHSITDIATQKTILKKVYYPSEKDGLFTPQEMQILRMICNGLSNPEIAKYLHLSIDTVKTHRKNIMYKAECNKETMLVRYAIENNLL